MTALIQRLAIGLRRHPVRFAIELGVALAALWSLIEPVLAFLPIEVKGWSRLLALLFVAIVVGIWRALPADAKTLAMPGTTSHLTIKYGNLFDEKGTIAVPVNEYFDSALGPHVAPRSVHGQVITNYFDGDSGLFDAAVDSALASVSHESVQRPSGRQRRYPVGTTAHLQTGQPTILAFVLTETDLTTLKVSADVPQMWYALHGLWQAARVHCNDRPLALPLVGGGLAGVGVSPQQLLSILVMSVAAESRRKRICADVHICILPTLRSSTDIEAAFELLN